MTPEHARAILDGPDQYDVVSAGDGPVVALAHGAGGGIRENFATLLDRSGHRWTGPSYPGAGATPRAHEPLSLEALADAVVAAGVAAGANRFPVVGISLGAAVAVTAAVRHPEHVSRLVLTVGVAHADAQSRAFAAAARALEGYDDRAALAALGLHATASPATLADLDPDGYDAAIAQAVADYSPGGADHLELVGRVDVRPLLPEVTVPTLVVVAGSDRIVLPETARELAGITGATLSEYPQAGHIFTVDEAARWADEVVAFVGGP